MGLINNHIRNTYIKKIFLYLFLMVSISASAQSVKSINLEFNQDDFELQKEEKGVSISSRKHLVTFDTDAYSPALPYVCISVLIGENDKWLDTELSSERILIENDVEMVANPINYKHDPNYQESQIERVVEYDKTKVYPQKKVRYAGTHHLGEYKYLSFQICPFEYNAETKSLFLYSNVNLNIKLQHVKSDAERNRIKTKKTAFDQIVKMVVNPDDVNRLYQTDNLRNGMIDSLYHYLIVTVDSFKNEYQRLADWKTVKGCRAKVITLEEIAEYYPTDTSFVSIKKMIKNIYNRNNWDLQYVLLGGATNRIPTLNCYSENIFVNHVDSAKGACDVYYSCLEDVEWDKNHNNNYGELSDSVDLTQWVSVSRLSTLNNSEVRVNVNRIIEYEQCPDTVGWKNEILMCGNMVGKLVDVNENGDSISDSHKKCELIYSDYIAPTSWNGSKFRFYDTGTDHPDSANYDITAVNLQAELNKGYAFTHVRAHGFEVCWGMEAGRQYSTYDASLLSAPRYSVIMTDACKTNNIKSPSFFLGNAFMKNNNGSVIAYYGCSENNMSYSLKFLMPCETFCARAWQELFSGSTKVGKAIRDSKNAFLSACYNTYSDERWLYLYMIPLCDPELTVYSQKPQPITNMQIDHRYEDISWVFANNNAKVCVMSRLDKGNSYYNVWDYYGQSTFHLQANEYLVTVTRTNCLPYSTIFGNVVYLQNEQLENNLNVLAEQVRIGSDVNSDRVQGPVVVENGCSSISAEFGTTIYNDFEVKLGASLEINTNCSVSQ